MPRRPTPHEAAAGAPATVAPPAPQGDRAPSGATAAGRALAHPALLWAAFVVVHVVVAWLDLRDGAQPMGDVVNVYAGWMREGLAGEGWVGVDTAWVYPLLAAVPMLLSRLAGPEHVGVTWLVLVTVLDLVAFAVLRRTAPDRSGAAWAWTAFVLLLGPIALGRIDAVTVALGVAGVLLLATRPALAGTLLAVGAWVKVWPAALVVAALVAGGRGLRGQHPGSAGAARRDAGAGGAVRPRVLVAAAATSAVVVAVSLALGSGWTVLGPLTEQAGRGLQIEAPLATLAMWRAALGAAGSSVAFDHDIITFQVTGDGVATTARLATPLMALVVAGVVLLGVRALRGGASAAALLPPLVLGLVAALLVTNKVGSPQFTAWFAVPLVLGLVLARRGGPSPVAPTVLVLATAALTQVVYPWGYDALVLLRPWALSVLTVRNALEAALLVVAAVQLWRAGTVGVGRRAGARTTLVA